MGESTSGCEDGDSVSDVCSSTHRIDTRDVFPCDLHNDDIRHSNQSGQRHQG